MDSNSLLLSVLFPIIAVALGFCIAIIFRPTISNRVKLLLSFSGAFLLAITIFDFLPEVYETGGKSIGLYIICGVLMQILLEFGSKGAEHGHMHENQNKRFPLLLFLSLGIHAFVEGFPITNNSELLYGVVIHKIPIAIIVSAFLINSNIRKSEVVLFLIGFAMMTPLGAFAKAYIPTLQTYSIYLDAFAIGVLLHVASTILFESSKNHQFNASKFVAIVLGICIAYFI